MSNKYSPTSHFFADHHTLADAVITNKVADSYGPVNPVDNNPTTKFRTTSFVRASSLTKVFAICKGQILIQQNSDNFDKLNLILKPDTDTYAPIKIKYFIYRGVDKGDLISSFSLRPKNPSDPNQPIFLQKLWDIFNRFNAPFNQVGGVGTPPADFPANKIGFDPGHQTPDSLLDSYFYHKTDTSSNNFYQLPPCNVGDHIGNFTGVLGLDIVLDQGSYTLENQRELFHFDLRFARANENVLDLDPLSSAGSTLVARYKEYVNQFMDAAAFWGSHIACGNISLYNNIPPSINTKDNIHDLIFKKYQTASKLYIYVQGERDRSYNYYNQTRKISGLSTSPEINNTNGWPILIKDTPKTTPSGSVYTVQLRLQYSIANDQLTPPRDAIDPIDRYIFLDVISPNNDTRQYPLAENIVISNPGTPPPAIFTGDTKTITLDMQIANSKYCASFLMIFANLTQNFPLLSYFDELWPAKFNTTFALPTDSADLSYWATYDKSRLINLTTQINIGASIQNKVFLDTGLNPDNSSTPTKRRRLYMAVIKRNTNHTLEYNKLNVDQFFSGISNKKLNDDDAYSEIVYNDINFSTFKGPFTDNSDTNVNNQIIVDSLSLIHNTDFERKNSYFLLGITEDDYNKLIYDTASPDPLSIQSLPIDSDNVFFHLEEVSNPNTNLTLNLDVLLKDFKKYRVGLKYEDNTGAVVAAPLYPTSPANDVFVYTLDGYYFYSKDYSAYQSFYQNFANAKVEFRTKIDIPAIPGTPAIPAVVGYKGEFAFDWLRVGDNGNISPAINPEPSYKSTIVNGYKRASVGDLITEYHTLQTPQPPVTSDMVIAEMAYKTLKREYRPIPTANLDEQYYVHYLNLYSNTYINAIHPTPPSYALPVSTIELRVFVTINEQLNKLEFDYDNTLFTINIQSLPDVQITSGKIESAAKTITITCLRDFTDKKQIRVLAYPLGESNKDNALLAGIIIIGGNDSLARKNLKFVLVKVWTNVTGAIGGLEKGDFSVDEKTNLYHALHQSLITTSVDEEVLPLQNDNTFNNSYVINNQYIDYTAATLYQYLRSRIVGINAKYVNYFTVFAFDVQTQPFSDGSFVVGKVDDIGIHSVIVYKSRNYMTLSHESLHGLGLRHTHRDMLKPPTPSTITDPRQRYIYPNGNADLAHATDNYMSYSGSLRKSIWIWQIELINRFLT